jgi:cardiolipin synthase
LPYVSVPLIFKVFLLAVHAVGVVTAVHAIMRTRSSQGAIAWVLGLLTVPYLSLPLYWAFGGHRFYGYLAARELEGEKIAHLRALMDAAPQDLRALPPGGTATYAVFARLAHMPFLPGNTARLLIDGEVTFEAIFSGIDAAKEYVLVQFFIFRDDRIGRALQEKLIAKARAGVRVFLIYDEIGSHELAGGYLRKLRDAGVEARAFRNDRELRARYQINFRNHRKIVIVDGQHAYVGGLNVGDEYMGRDPGIGRWRDTHVAISGPAVKAVQLCFIGDWHWATGQVPALDWSFPPGAEGGTALLVLPTGPSDGLDTCTLFFVQAIQSASRRVWITSPYFVPDSAILAALQLAVLRGVDVRILLPMKPDHLLAWLASFSYLKEMLPRGVKMYRYQDGFLHQKVMLIDDTLASVGTANLDTRSLRLNFEITLLFADTRFAAEVCTMLEEDFARSLPLLLSELSERSFLFRFAVRAARLLAPVL